MMALRWVLLVLGCAVAGWAVISAAGGSIVPSAGPVLVAALAALLAPLLWPGSGPSPANTALRVLRWSGACVATVAAVLAWAAPGAALAVTALLGAMLVAAHAAAALLERAWLGAAGRRAEGPADAAGATGAAAAAALAGGLVATLLALTASLPLWLGPFVQLGAADRPWAAAAAVAASPLMHLAAAAGNDLPRSDWFYERTVLASLQFGDLDPRWLAAGWLTAAAALLALVAWPLRRPPAPVPPA